MASDAPAMRCPRCGETTVQPLSVEFDVIAWYRCQACTRAWSTRLRGGRVADMIIDEESGELEGTRFS